MDSKIPKPSGGQKRQISATSSNTLFDFNAAKRERLVDENKALTGKNKNLYQMINLFESYPFDSIVLEISNTKSFTEFKFNRSKSPDLNFGRSEKVMPKMRRSKSHADLNVKKPANQQSVRPGMKRFQSTLDNVPSKRLKTGIIRPQLMIMKTQEKKNAILSTIKTTDLVKTAVLKKPLVKSNSHGPALGSTSTFNSRLASSKSTLTSTKATITSVPKAAVSAAVTTKAKPKIPPYDFKARFLDLKERHDALKEKYENEKEQKIQLEEASESYESREKELLDKIQKIDQELFDAIEAKEKLEEEFSCLRKTNNSLVIKNNALAADLSLKSEDLTTTKKKLSELMSAHDKQTIEFEELKRSSGTMQHDFEQASTQLLLSQDQLYQINIERKVLHNMVLDLRGNIRVFARVRPPLPSEAEKMVCGWSFTDESSLEIHNNELVPSGASRKLTKHDFSFDQVFDPNTSQDDIFEMVRSIKFN